MDLELHLNQAEFDEQVKKYEDQHLKEAISNQVIMKMILDQKQFQDKFSALQGEKVAKLISEAKQELKSLGYKQKGNEYILSK